jgi:acetoin utilization deacetylase AcuC-like enzyme
MVPFPLIHREGFYLPFGKAHVFPGVKYKLIRERLIANGIATDASFQSAERIDLADVLRVHEAGYVDRLINGTLDPSEIRRMELPYSKNLVEATLLGCGGTLLAARLALQHGIAMSIGGGFHHAHPDHGEGFCMLHDVAIALHRLLHDSVITSALVVDLDVHQGNGTAAIFPPMPAERAFDQTLVCGSLAGPGTPGEDGVFTLSIHQRNIYPAYKPPSSIDVHLDNAVEDADYLEALEKALSLSLEKFRPDLIAYVAGSDPYYDDKLGGLGLTIEGLRERDLRVFQFAQKKSVPIFSVFAGGYARQLEDTVTIHSNTVLAAMEVFKGKRRITSA